MAALHEIPRIVGVASSGRHKACNLRPFLATYGHTVQPISIEGEIEELEHVSPRQVIARKIVDYAKHAEGALSFWAEVKTIPTPGVFVVMDVLAENAPDGPRSPLQHSNRVMKKAKLLNPIYAAAEHFSAMAEQEVVDGRLWNAYIAAAGMAPIGARGEILLDKAVSLWDNPIWFGYTQKLVETLADPKQVMSLLERGSLSQRVFSANSIEGLKQEHLAEGLATMGELDGMSMRVVYGGKTNENRIDVTIDSRQDRGTLDFVFGFLYPALANSTPGLARQMDDVMKTFPV